MDTIPRIPTSITIRLFNIQFRDRLTFPSTQFVRLDQDRLQCSHLIYLIATLRTQYTFAVRRSIATLLSFA